MRKIALSGAMRITELIQPHSSEDVRRALSEGRHLHFTGKSERFTELMPWSEVNRLADIFRLWSDRTFRLLTEQGWLASTEYCFQSKSRDGHLIWRPDTFAVGEWLERGAALWLDRVETLSAPLNRLSASLASALGGRTACSILAAARNQYAVPLSFEAATTLIVAVEGSRRWRLYTGRFEHPVDRPGYSFESLSPAQHQQLCGRVKTEIALAPGGALMVPAGRYFDALPGDGPGLTLMFRVAPMTGLEAVRFIVEAMAEDVTYRAAMPKFDSSDAHRDHLQLLAEGLRDLSSNRETLARLRTRQRDDALRGLCSTYSLPSRETPETFRVRTVGNKLVRRGKEWQLRTATDRATIGPGGGRLAEWVRDQSVFTRDDAAAAFPEIAPTEIRDALGRFASMGFIERI